MVEAATWTARSRSPKHAYLAMIGMAGFTFGIEIGSGHGLWLLIGHRPEEVPRETSGAPRETPFHGPAKTSRPA
jgi:hypothetical protein